MNAPQFSSILDRPSDSIERPKPLPVGTYLFSVKGQYKEDVSSQKKTPYVEWQVVPMQPGEDVDAADLEEALTNKATGEKKALSEKTLRATYYTTDDAIWRLKEFLTHLGIEDGPVSLRQRMSAAAGCQFLGSIVHDTGGRDGTPFAKLGNTAPVEA